ncbi:hypothetical protein BJV74DRAFT_822062, partial [Russula compacta]
MMSHGRSWGRRSERAVTDNCVVSPQQRKRNGTNGRDFAGYGLWTEVVSGGVAYKVKREREGNN